MLPSRAIARLNRLVEFLESAHNLFVRIFDPVIFYRLQFVLAAESWRRRLGRRSACGWSRWGNWRRWPPWEATPTSIPRMCFLNLSIAPCFEAVALAHPLIPRERAVGNDLCLDRNLQLMIVSGPNMAGKSTFLRGIGVNAVLAQSGAPVRAAS
jgi:hypothetical protein